MNGKIVTTTILTLTLFIGGTVYFSLQSEPDQENALSGTPTLRTQQGGTGTSTEPTDLQLLVGQNGGQYGVRTLTAGSNVSISTSTSALTISASVSGAGSGTVGTSTDPNIGDLAYWTGVSTLGTTATGTLSESVTGLALSASRYLVGGSASLSLDSGYAIPTTTRLVNHDTAFSWGDHGTQGYLTTVDISDDTNLTGDSEIVLTGDTLSIASSIARDSELHDAVTLAGQNYLSLSGQQITAGTIEPDDLASSDFGDFTCNGTTCSLDATYLTTVDISDDTNLVGGTNLTLSGDTLNVDDAFLLNNGDIGTGVFDFGGTTSFEITNASNCSGSAIDTSGEVCINTGSSTVSFYDGSEERVLYPYDIVTITNLGSTTVTSNASPSFDTGTSTYRIRNFKEATTLDNFYCKAGTGTLTAVIGDGSASTSPLRFSTGSDESSPSNNTFNAREDIILALGSTASADDVTCTLEFKTTAQ